MASGALIRLNMVLKSCKSVFINCHNFIAMDFKNLKNASHKLNMTCSIFIRLYTVLSKIVFSWCFMSNSYGYVGRVSS